jgi:5-methyltetrahydropteroyltriglutamate--homocysteine methyltransferase
LAKEGGAAGDAAGGQATRRTTIAASRGEWPMQRSNDRILTTHAGSLPRPDDLLAMMRSRLRGEAVDEAAYNARVRSAVGEIVKKQADLGIDTVSDGEMSKPSFLTYVTDRLAGFELDTEAPRGSPFAKSREFQAFPEFYEWLGRAMPSPAVGVKRIACTGPVSYKGQALVKTDIDNLKAALKGADVADAFIPAISPSSIEDWQRNKYYKSTEEYLYAIADAMREEYKAIVDAGLLLQIDDPMLATCYVMYANMSVEDCRKWIALRIDVLNHALRDIPRERVRWHTCYGINIGPRVHDLQLKDVIDLFVRVSAGALSFEGANPRHEHEWRMWKDAKLADGTILIPGVITQSSVLVEHPDLIADRIERFASVVGRENVIAGTDCGFGTFAGSEEIHPSVVWAKFEALAEGARLASDRLWKRKSAAA